VSPLEMTERWSRGPRRPRVHGWDALQYCYDGFGSPCS